MILILFDLCINSKPGTCRPKQQKSDGKFCQSPLVAGDVLSVWFIHNLFGPHGSKEVLLDLASRASPEHGLQPWSWVPHDTRVPRVHENHKQFVSITLFQKDLCPISCFAAELHCQDGASPTAKSPAKSCLLTSCNIKIPQIHNKSPWPKSTCNLCNHHDCFAVFSQETRSWRGFGMRIDFSPAFLVLWLGERRGRGQGGRWNNAHFVPAADTCSFVQSQPAHSSKNTEALPTNVWLIPCCPNFHETTGKIMIRSTAVGNECSQHFQTNPGNWYPKNW